ncbi:MAG: LysR family transcriptional regulator [Ruminiclostridium sp.]|nr:LysR family transcriptional regulator [Ruminiclostridium sp.]
MNLSHLRYIAEVAKTGSITKAAQNLYMGQPNLSKAIREMEKYMGTAIFKRTSKGVEPTEKGKEIVERARALLKSADDFERDFCNKKDRIETITVGVCGSEYCISVLEDMAAKWAGENVSFEFFRCDFLELVKRVKEGEISFGISRAVFDREDFFERLGVKRQILAEGKLLTAINHESPLCEKEKISFYSDLTGMVRIAVSGADVSKDKMFIGVSDHASGERIVEKNSKCYMLVSSLDISRRSSMSDKIVYKENRLLTAQDAPLMHLNDVLVYAEGKSFSVREKEIIERCYFGAKSDN